MQIEGALHPKYREPKQYQPDLIEEADIAWASHYDDDEKNLEIIKRIELRENILRRNAHDNFLAFFQYAFYNDRLSEDGLSVIRKPIQPQWYQEEWTNAINESRRVIIISPRSHGKTTYITARAIWEIGRNPTLRIKIVCAADGMAKQRLYEIKNHIENNERIKKVFPNLVRDPDGEWSRHRLYIIRDTWHRDASIEAFSITATATGGRADILISDDAVDRRNSISLPKLRQMIKQTWKSDITQLLEPTSKIWAVATPWHRDDLTHELMSNPVFRKMRIAILDDYGSMFPEKWPESELRLRALEIGSQEFARGFKCVAIDDESQPVNPKWIHFINPDKIPDNLVIFVSYDTAKGIKESNDYTAGVIIGVDETEKKVYVLDAWHARLTLDKRAVRIYEDIVYWNPYRTLIEETGLSETVSWLLNIHPELAGTVIAVNPRKKKYERLTAVTPLMERGNVLFSSDLDSLNENDTFEPGRGDLINELLEFPIGAHDDLVDALSQSLNNGARQYLLDDWAPGTGDIEEDLDPEDFILGGY